MINSGIFCYYSYDTEVKLWTKQKLFEALIPIIKTLFARERVYKNRLETKNEHDFKRMQRAAV